MANTVIGFFDNASEARDAVDRLVQSGVDRVSIDLSSGNASGTSAVGVTDDDTTSRSTTESNSAYEKGEHTGSAIARFFHSLFGDDKDEADRYTTVGSSSDTIVTVHARTSEEADRAADILDEAGAVDVDERAASLGASSSYAGSGRSGEVGEDLAYDATTPSTAGLATGSDFGSAGVGLGAVGGGLESAPDAGLDTTGISTGINDAFGTSGAGLGTTGTDDNKIDRVEEELQVGKRSVQTGRVRVRSRIISRPVEENLRLREEHVRVERTPVNRAVSDLDAFQEQEIELQEFAEVPVVNKEARVVEEIRVGKDVNERDETIRDTVRKTDVEIEDTGNTSPGIRPTGRSEDVRRSDSDSDGRY